MRAMHQAKVLLFYCSVCLLVKQLYITTLLYTIRAMFVVNLLYIYSYTANRSLAVNVIFQYNFHSFLRSIYNIL